MGLIYVIFYNIKCKEVKNRVLNLRENYHFRFRPLKIPKFLIFSSGVLDSLEGLKQPASSSRTKHRGKSKRELLIFFREIKKRQISPDFSTKYFRSLYILEVFFTSFNLVYIITMVVYVWNKTDGDKMCAADRLLA